MKKFQNLFVCAFFGTWPILISAAEATWKEPRKDPLPALIQILAFALLSLGLMKLGKEKRK